MSNTHKIKQNDTAPKIQATLRDGNDDVVNLASCAVVFIMKALGATTPKVNRGAAVIDNAAGGVVSYQWVAADTDTVGEYDAEWEVTFPSGLVETFPNDDYNRVIVTEELG